MELLAHDVVIVLPQRIVGQLIFPIGETFARRVVQGHAHNGFRTLQELSGVETLFQMVFHIVHFRMVAL